MIAEIFIVLVTGIVLFELAEHVVIPLAAGMLGKPRQPASGAEAMVGKVVEVVRWKGTTGQVLIGGELWKAASEAPLVEGDEAVVRSIKGLTLRVEPPSRAPES